MHPLSPTLRQLPSIPPNLVLPLVVSPRPMSFRILLARDTAMRMTPSIHTPGAAESRMNGRNDGNLDLSPWLAIEIMDGTMKAGRAPEETTRTTTTPTPTLLRTKTTKIVPTIDDDDATNIDVPPPLVLPLFPLRSPTENIFPEAISLRQPPSSSSSSRLLNMPCRLLPFPLLLPFSLRSILPEELLMHHLN